MLGIACFPPSSSWLWSEPTRLCIHWYFILQFKVVKDITTYMLGSGGDPAGLQSVLEFHQRRAQVAFNHQLSTLFGCVVHLLSIFCTEYLLFNDFFSFIFGTHVFDFDFKVGSIFMFFSPGFTLFRKLRCYFRGVTPPTGPMLFSSHPWIFNG